METLHPARLDEATLLSHCRARRQRRSGPGGQHRNKVETAVTIEHIPSGICGEASERRNQAQNRRMAIFRLRINLAIQQRTPGNCEADRPSELWRRRCRKQRITVNRSHDDFPALLAEALDVLAAMNWDRQKAATFLDCSGSQLVKFLHLEPRAWMELNRQRAERGLRPLH